MGSHPTMKEVLYQMNEEEMRNGVQQKRVVPAAPAFSLLAVSFGWLFIASFIPYPPWFGRIFFHLCRRLPAHHRLRCGPSSGRGPTILEACRSGGRVSLRIFTPAPPFLPAAFSPSAAQAPALLSPHHIPPPPTGLCLIAGVGFYIHTFNIRHSTFRLIGLRSSCCGPISKNQSPGSGGGDTDDHMAAPRTHLSLLLPQNQ